MNVKILKFGGSSIEDAKRIEHVVDIILHQKNDFNLAVVFSAIGGITNLLEIMTTKIKEEGLAVSIR
jgi:aspartokinase/homoserine dehydrogenase 1